MTAPTTTICARSVCGGTATNSHAYCTIGCRRADQLRLSSLQTSWGHYKMPAMPEQFATECDTITANLGRLAFDPEQGESY